MEDNSGDLFGFGESAHQIVDEMPSMVFLMDKFPMVIGMNSLAREMSGLEEVSFYEKRFGELFNCINSIRNSSCGTTSACVECQIRNIYRQTQFNGNVVRRRVEMIQTNKGCEVNIRQFILTAYKLESLTGGATVIIADDISDIV
ncbi:MAG: hypothetical protein LWY06_02640 [Firmicutes bacterium]|nr:hypothetical protein [Bacillota bacterium]